MHKYGTNKVCIFFFHELLNVTQDLYKYPDIIKKTGT